MTAYRTRFLGGGYAHRYAIGLAALCMALTSQGRMLAAEIPGFSYSDGIRTLALTLVTDEVAVRGDDDAIEVRHNQPPTTANELKLFLRQIAVNEGRETLAVFYRPSDAPARLETGRVLLPSRLIVLVEDDAQADAIFTRHGLTKERKLDYLPNTYILRAANPFAALAAANRIAAQERVLFATPLVHRQLKRRQHNPDPLFVDQWHLDNTGQAGGTPGEDLDVIEVWDGTVTGQPVTGAGAVIGIIDEGLEFLSGNPPVGRAAHPDLVATLAQALSHDFRDQPEDDNTTPPCGTCTASVVDSEWHGTAVAGIVGAEADNGVGITGVAPGAVLASLRLLRCPAPKLGNDAQQADALSWANQQIHIYNNSWGPSDTTATHVPSGAAVRITFLRSVHEARSGLGSIFTWAAGNGQQNSNDVNYDGWANSRFTIAVGASDDFGMQSGYSEPGACLLVNAPSDGLFSPIPEQIVTTDLTGTCGLDTTGAPNGDYLEATDSQLQFIMGGTSAAAPQVAGVMALMLEVNPNLSWRDVQDILVRTGVRTPLATFDNTPDGDGNGWNGAPEAYDFHHNYGFGRVSASATVTAANALNWASLQHYSVTVVDGTVAGSNFPVTIPDDATPVDVTFDVPAARNIESIEHVEIRVDISHGAWGDLDIRLISPNLSVLPQGGNPPGSRAFWPSSTRSLGDRACGPT